MSEFINYDHLLTTCPNDIEQVVISDLHLSASEPALVQAFLTLLADLQVLPQLRQLYILGDWFDAWIGDDAYLSLNDSEKQSHWITPLIKELKQLRLGGCDILVMHGNRDFLLGQAFCSTFGGTLIYEPYSLVIGQQRFRLEHGDALCTDDKAYQRFRKLMRSRLVQWYLLNKSLENRLKIADKMRQKSQQGNAKKAAFIMDVNAQAVSQAVQCYEALLHGHTHRPALHRLAEQEPAANDGNGGDKIRYVLGDWRLIDKDSSWQYVEAVIGIVMREDRSQESAKEKFVLTRYIDRGYNNK
ncbi:UDP-2,3-diacylglucosamine diphosphatase [Psychrobacter pygoscelis]|uniref:UDP-2,3-diacylglucosamine diphosphatase n=1 Tax=Psychrobacter pygoscelis TaxID=2488563 RepID=UPI00103FEFE9|nr:UDP-2,3-diacylglucosamine diphosphatase [Psychrobacter pygoscelis]